MLQTHQSRLFTKPELPGEISGSCSKTISKYSLVVATQKIKNETKEVTNHQQRDVMMRGVHVLYERSFNSASVSMYYRSSRCLWERRKNISTPGGRNLAMLCVIMLLQTRGAGASY